MNEIYPEEPPTPPDLKSGEPERCSAPMSDEQRRIRARNFIVAITEASESNPELGFEGVLFRAGLAEAEQRNEKELEPPGFTGTEQAVYLGLSQAAQKIVNTDPTRLWHVSGDIFKHNY